MKCQAICLCISRTDESTKRCEQNYNFLLWTAKGYPDLNLSYTQSLQLASAVFPFSCPPPPTLSFSQAVFAREGVRWAREGGRERGEDEREGGSERGGG